MKTRLFTLFLALTASVGTIFAQSGTCGENLTWNLADNVLTINGTGEMDDYNNLMNVPWYIYRSDITSVIIANGVTSIGRNAFYFFTSLTTIDISNSVISIGEGAFADCTSLTSIEIPNSVTTIIGSAFSYCTGLTSIEIPNSVTRLDAGAFDFCTNLVSIIVAENNNNYSSKDGVLFNKEQTMLIRCPNGKQGTYIVPNSVTGIEKTAFSQCNGLTSIIIPNSVTSIGISAFYNCTGLTSMIIPSGVTSIGNYAFYGCTGMTSFTCKAVTPPTCGINVFYNVDKSIPLYVPSESIAAYQAANSWKSFTNIQAIVDNPEPCMIGSGTCGNNLSWELSCDGVLTISGTGAMEDYTYFSPTPWATDSLLIQSVVIEEGVSSIGNHAFAEYKNLTSISIPSTIVSIGAYACTWNSVTNLIIPNSVITIGEGAFSGCRQLTDVTLSNRLKKIEQNVFSYCTGLISIVIPDSVTSIESGAFNQCFNLESITIPDGVTSIGKRAFNMCYNLREIIIPKNTVSIGDNAFCTCLSLTSITNYAIQPQQINENVFSGSVLGATDKSTCKLYVPAGSIAAYQAADVWKDFGNILPIEETPAPCVVASGTCGENLTWTLSCDNVLTISGTGAMWNYLNPSDEPWYSYRSSITSLVIEDNVTSISWNFRGLTGLSSVVIGNSITNIESGAFEECTGLSSLTIGNHVTSIGTAAFNRCLGLTSIEIPNSVTSIGNRAFWNCFYVTSPVYIHNNVTNIGADAFGACSIPSFEVNSDNSNYCAVDGVLFDKTKHTLIQYPGGNPRTEYTIPETVTSIEYGAFDGAELLTSITIGNNVTSIGDDAFSFCMGLTSIEIPNSVTSIERFTFSYCSNLTSVVLPNSIVNINDGAFAYCRNLTSFTNYATTPQTLKDEYVFSDVNLSNCTLYVPAQSVAAYQAAAVWKDFTQILPIASESAPAVYTNPVNSAQKLIRNGNVYILSGDKTYTITGQHTK